MKPPVDQQCSVAGCGYPAVRYCDEPTCRRVFCGKRPMFGDRTPAHAGPDPGCWCNIAGHEVGRQKVDESLQHERRYYGKKEQAG